MFTWKIRSFEWFKQSLFCFMVLHSFIKINLLFRITDPLKRKSPSIIKELHCICNKLCIYLITFTINLFPLLSFLTQLSPQLRPSLVIRSRGITSRIFRRTPVTRTSYRSVFFLGWIQFKIKSFRPHISSWRPWVFTWRHGWRETTHGFLFHAVQCFRPLQRDKWFL